MTVVTLCTDPPQFFNGVGPTPAEAGDTAAVSAMRKLSEVGLEGVCGEQGVTGLTQGVAGLTVTESTLARLVATLSMPAMLYQYILLKRHTHKTKQVPSLH